MLFVAVFVASCIFFFGLYWLLEPLTVSLKSFSKGFSFYYPDPRVTNASGEVAHFQFPSIAAPASVKLSVIVPAFNESKRLPPMLEDTLAALKRRSVSERGFTYEVIVVDDGSKDTTCWVVSDFVRKHSCETLRLLRLPYNKGKGGAVQQGVLHARGERILFADADGASDFSCLAWLEEKLSTVTTPDGYGIAIGSRSHLQDKAVAERKFYRTVLMKGFHLLVRYLGGTTEIRDTQCGFKLFTRNAARQVFANQRIMGWCFDVELLTLAKIFKIPVTEVSINWAEVDGSKLNIADASFKMARDLAIIRFAYSSGLWKVQRV